MGVASELAVKFTADTSGLEAGGQKAEGLIGRMTSGLGKLGLAGMGVGVIKDAIGGVVGSFGDLIGAAEAAGDAKARLDIVLGSSAADKLTASAEKNAVALGMSKTQYLETAGAISTYLDATGLASDKVATMAGSMTELIPKFAALNNTTSEAVSSAFEDAMKGRVRGLGNLGVAIDTNAISKMDDAAKAQYIYAQILAKSGDATKAWGDNQHDVAASMDTVKAAIDNAKTAIGEGLLPLIAPLAEKFAGLASTVSETIGPIGAIIKAAFGSDLDSAREQLGTLSDLLGGKLGDSVGAVAFALGSMGGAIKSFALGDITQGFADLGDVILNLVDVVGRMTGLDVAGIKSFLFGDDLSGGAWKTFTDTIKTVFETVKSSFETGKGIVTDAMSAIGGAIGNVDWAGMLSTLVDGFNNARPGIEAFIDAAVERFQYFKDEILPPVIDFVVNTLIPAFEDFGKRAADGFAIVAPIVTMLAAKFMEFGNVVIEKVWPIVKSIFGFISDHSGVFVTLGAIIAVVAGGPITMLIGVLALIGTIVPKVIEWFEDVKAKIADMGAAIGQRVTEITAWWQSVKDSTAAAWQAVKDAVAGAVQAILDWIKEKFQAAKDFIQSVQDGIKKIINDIWMAIPADIRARLIEIYNNIVAKFEAVKQAISDKLTAAREAIATALTAIADAIKTGAQAAYDFFIQPYVDLAIRLYGIFEEIKTTVLEKITAFIEPIKAKWEEIKTAILAKLAGLIQDVSIGFNNMKVAITDKLTEAKNAVLSKAREIVDNILSPIKNAGSEFTTAGTNIIEGLRKGIEDAWGSLKDWFWNKIRSLIGLGKDALEEKSPSKAFAEIGENVVAGLELGLQGIKQIGDWIQKEMVGWVKDKDLENFGSIATLTGSLVDIFENTTKALKSLLSFDVSTSAAQISAQFKALVGTFQTALLEMKTLAQYAGRGAPKEKEIADAFLNFFDIQNIELVSKGFDATINLINGLLDIAAKLQTVKVPSASDIEALLEPMSKLGDVAARFIHSVGKPEGEDATAYFQNGANTTAALASWAKSIADIVGIKFGTVAKDFEAQMTAAADASVKAWNAVKVMAVEWGDKGVSEREKLLTGIQAYATAVGAAAGILKAVAELKIDVATLAAADQMKLAAEASKNAVARVAEVAKDWIGGAKWIENAVAGIKAYAEAAGAAVSLLKAAADLDLSKMVAATDDQLRKAADVSLKALGELGRVAAAFVSMGAEARTALVQAVKDYAEAAGAAVGLLGGAAALDFTKAVAVTGQQLHDAADATLAALGELQRVAAGFVTMGHEATGPLVQSIKDFAEGAGAAVDLLVKGAQGMNALGEIKRLSGIQPRLIRAILKQLRDVVDIVTDPKNAPKTPTEEQLAALKSLGDSSGVFDGIVKAAAGMNELGQVKRLSGVQPRLIRTVLSQLSTVIGIVTDPKTALKPITSEQAAAIKAIGDSSGVLSSLSSVADGFAKMSGKLSIPSDLSERVTTLIDAMRTVVSGIAGAMTGEGAINLKDAVAGADIAEAVGRIGDAFGPIFDAINAAIESPFGRIKATGQRGDTFRQNIANRIKASLVAAVTALSEALGSMPTITIPDGLSEQIDKLAGIYDRILDVIGKLDGVKIDTRAVASLAAALGVLAGGVGGVGAGNISVTGGGSQLSVASGPGGGIVINNEFNPTLTPLPITINTTNNISVSGKVVESIATEVQRLEELKLRQGGTP